MKNDNQHPFLAIRSNSKIIAIDSGGYWSYPALVVKDKSLQWLCLILPIAPLPEKKRSALFRPKAMVVLDANSAILIRFENFRKGTDLFPNEKWDNPIGMFPHKDLWGMTYKQLEEAENQLLYSYEEAGKSFLEKGTLPDAFVEDYLKLLHPAFLPYLKVVAPSFFSALASKLVKGVLAHKS
jgi:hypothetical protein